MCKVLIFINITISSFPKSYETQSSKSLATTNSFSGNFPDLWKTRVMKSHRTPVLQELTEFKILSGSVSFIMVLLPTAVGLKGFHLPWAVEEGR
jgi:hypothetical protein